VTKRERLAAARRRYEQTAKGKATLKRWRDKRIFIGHNDCIGIAATAEQARAINAHIQRRKRVFITGLSTGTEAQGDASGAVSPETAV
jgi:DNA-binding PadR family transcriptional regulator